MAYSWDLPTINTQLSDYYEKYGDALGALLANHLGTDDPAVDGDAHAVAGTRWDDTNTNTCKARNTADSAWVIVHDLDVDYGGLLPRAGTSTYPMTGDLDFDGNDLILDGDGDSKITTDTDDEIGVEVGGTEVLRIGEVVSSQKLLDLQGQLRLAQPQGITAGAAGSATYRFPVDIDGAGTLKYVELCDAP